MKRDEAVRSAIQAAVAKAGQPTGLATKLIAWFEDSASGNPSLEQREAVHRRLDLLFDEVRVEIDDDED